MLTLDVLRSIKLTNDPSVQKAVGHIIRANFAFPPTRTKVVIEGIERLDVDRPVYIAMNHTDRYNYWPFQVHLWRDMGKFTATWVKGKYYNNPVIQRFMIAANNIPTPSKGYIMTQDGVATLGRPFSDEMYRAIRDAWDAGLAEVPSDELSDEDRRDLDRLRETSRDMLGHSFSAGDGYLTGLNATFDQMMDAFVALNDAAFDLGLQVLVFPEGTRSRTLGVGRPGLAQMLLRTKASVVCVGCNGSDFAYPGNNPFSRGGRIVYRVGKILTPEDALAEFQIDEDYRPFTNAAQKHSEKFAGCTELVMNEISSLLDPQYVRGDDSSVSGARRFL